MCVLEAGTRIMGKTGNVKAKASVFETNYRLRATICDERAQTPPPSPTLRRKFFRRFSPRNPGFCSFCSARSRSAAGGDGGFAAAGRRTKDSALRAEGRSAPPSLWGGEAATAHLGRAASAASDAGSPYVGRPESIQSQGAPAALRAAGKNKKQPQGAVFWRFFHRSRGGRRASLAFMESAISPPPPWAALLTSRTSHAPPRRKTARKAIPAVREGSSPARLPVGK